MICPDWRDILTGEKTEITHLVKPGDYLWRACDHQGNQIVSVRTGRGQVRWKVGASYSVQPHRHCPAIVWRQHGYCRYPIHASSHKAKLLLLADGWHEARIRITAIEKHPSNVWLLKFVLVEPTLKFVLVEPTYEQP